MGAHTAAGHQTGRDPNPGHACAAARHCSRALRAVQLNAEAPWLVWYCTPGWYQKLGPATWYQKLAPAHLAIKICPADRGEHAIALRAGLLFVGSPHDVRLRPWKGSLARCTHTLAAAGRTSSGGEALQFWYGGGGQAVAQVRDGAAGQLNKGAETTSSVTQASSTRFSISVSHPLATPLKLIYTPLPRLFQRAGGGWQQQGQQATSGRWGAIPKPTCAGLAPRFLACRDQVGAFSGQRKGWLAGEDWAWSCAATQRRFLADEDFPRTWHPQ